MSVLRSWASSDKATRPYLVTVELRQPVVLARDSFDPGAARRYWNVVRWGDIGKENLRRLRDEVNDTLDIFIGNYFDVNH